MNSSSLSRSESVRRRGFLFRRVKSTSTVDILSARSRSERAIRETREDGVERESVHSDVTGGDRSRVPSFVVLAYALSAAVVLFRRGRFWMRNLATVALHRSAKLSE